MERYFSLDGSQLWNFLTGPLLTALIWFALDYALKKLYEKISIVDRVFSGHTKANDIKRAILAALRLVLGIYFILILLDHFSIDSKPLISIRGEKLWGLLTGPILTVAIWAAL
ncbi:MAG: hypothetical protein LBB28_04850, partial [Synergistaceae bacterium]|nr:hypothetical protein [Synergistaceae bacterium]